jgi:hypothetical protein
MTFTPLIGPDAPQADDRASYEHRVYTTARAAPKVMFGVVLCIIVVSFALWLL